MASTLYDILEVSASASPETIRAAYERLSAKFKGDSAPEARMRLDAMKEAFLTLGDPAKRQRYDKSLATRLQPIAHNVEVVEPFWTTPKIIVLAVILIFGGGYYYKHKREEARLEAEKAIAATKAKEAEETARAQAEQARLELIKQREEAAIEAQQRRDREAALRQYDADRRVNQRENQQAQRAKTADERRELQQQKSEERQAAAAARQRAAQEKAELCRMERQRYGRAISC